MRFYNVLEIPFTHDEFSALFRTNFDSFSALIEGGVKVDGHPAGLQVFTYYWVKAFGYSEWGVKLPFILAGICSIYLIYRIGEMWFNETVGLLSAAVIASIQYTVMYSQIARPYGSGIFLSLAMVFFWTKVIRKQNTKLDINEIGFILFAAANTYNHHFGLLLAAIVGLSGLFFVKKDFVLRYVIIGVSIFALYIPHLSIFFHQLSVGGISWLAEPKSDFLIEYLKYALNFSYLGYFAICAVIVFGVVKSKVGTLNYKFIILSFSWFLIPFSIGFLYSVYVNTVLQYSILIFSFPFLVLGFMSFYKRQKEIVNLLLVILILAVNVYSLVFVRNHYQVFYQGHFDELLIDFKDRAMNNEKIISIIDLDDEISSQYFEKLGIDQSFIDYNQFNSEMQFQLFMDSISINYDTLFLSAMHNIHPEAVAMIKEHYPSKIYQKNYVEGESYMFCKGLLATSHISYEDFERDDDPSNSSFELDYNNEYFNIYKGDLRSITTHENNFIDVSLDCRVIEDKGEIVLVTQLKADGKSIHWAGKKFYSSNAEDNSKWSKIHHSLKLSDVYQNYKDIEIIISVWNKDKSLVLLDNIKVDRRDGNPWIYGLYEPLFSPRKLK